MIEATVKDSYLWDEIHQQETVVPQAIQANKPILQQIAAEVRARGIRQVIMAGRGSSEHALRVGRRYFENQVGMFCEIFSPSALTSYDAKLDFSDKLVIGVSQCGQAKDVYTLLAKAQQDGAVVVSITNADDSLMNGIRKYYINCRCGVEHSFTAGKSYMTQAALVLELAALIADDQAQVAAIEGCGPLLAASHSCEEAIRQALPMFRNASSIFVIGRGYAYAVALEAELKLQEASYVNARAYASSDYQHGPIANTDRFTPYVFFLTDAKTDGTTAALLAKLKQLYRITALVVTNKDEYMAAGDYAVRLPDGCEGPMAVFGLGVFAQTFACLLSFARGYHPDKPVNLSKTTVTF